MQADIGTKLTAARQLTVFAAEQFERGARWSHEDDETAFDTWLR